MHLISHICSRRVILHLGIHRSIMVPKKRFANELSSEACDHIGLFALIVNDDEDFAPAQQTHDTTETFGHTSLSEDVSFCFDEETDIKSPV